MDKPYNVKSNDSHVTNGNQIINQEAIAQVIYTKYGPEDPADTGPGQDAHVSWSASASARSFHQGVPKDRLKWSILNCVFCFVPLGIWAVIKSLQVRQYLKRSQYQQASLASNSAKNINIVGMALGVVMWCIVIIVIIGYTLQGKLGAKHTNSVNHQPSLP